MEAVHVAFKAMNEGEEPPPGYQKMECMTETLAVLTYVCVVSRDSVHIALTVAALNNIQVKAGDVQNAGWRPVRNESGQQLARNLF